MDKKPLKLLTVVIPVRDEEACIGSTVEHLSAELHLHNVSYEIIVAEDGSGERMCKIINEIISRISVVRTEQSPPPHGFGRAIIAGLDKMHGDAVGKPKLKIKEMGSRYLFSWLHVWLEKYLTRGDYRRS